MLVRNQKITTRIRYEVTRGDPVRLAVHRLNHSATLSTDGPCLYNSFMKSCTKISYKRKNYEEIKVPTHA